MLLAGAKVIIICNMAKFFYEKMMRFAFRGVIGRDWEGVWEGLEGVAGRDREGVWEGLGKVVEGTGRALRKKRWGLPGGCSLGCEV